MRVAICTQEQSADPLVDERFGRCRYYAVVETETGVTEYMSNEAYDQQGAGVKAARTILKAGVEAVVVGNIGPKAFEILTKAGITVYGGLNGTLSATLEQMRQGRLEKLQEANG